LYLNTLELSVITPVSPIEMMWAQKLLELKMYSINIKMAEIYALLTKCGAFILSYFVEQEEVF